MRNLFTVLIPAIMIFQGSAQPDSPGRSDGMTAVQADSSLNDSAAQEFIRSIDRLEIDSMAVSDGELLVIGKRASTAPGGWFFLLNCVLLGLLVVKYAVYQVYTRNSWRAWVNENLFFQLVREKAPVNLLLVLLENLLKIYMIAAAALLCLEFFLADFHMTALNLLQAAGALVLFFALKALALYMLAGVTDQVELLRVMNLNTVIAASNTAFAIIPLILVAAYLPPMVRPVGIYLVITAFGLGVIFLIFRALRIFLKARIPFNLQFFLYLCGLEILPYMFLVKVLNEQIVY